MIGWTVTVGGLTLGDGTSYGITRMNGLTRAGIRAARAERGDRDGEVGGVDVLTRRMISMGLRLRGASQASVWSLLTDLNTAWPPASTDTTLDVAAAELTGGRRFYGRPGSIEDDGMANLRFGQIDCFATFEALDPLGYGAEEEALAQSGTFAIDNVGTAPTDRITLTVNGNGGIPQLANATDGKTIKFAEAVTGTRVIDVRARTVLDGTTDAYGELSPTNQWFDLLAGSNSLTLSGAASVDVAWRPAWY